MFVCTTGRMTRRLNIILYNLSVVHFAFCQNLSGLGCQRRFSKQASLHFGSLAKLYLERNKLLSELKHTWNGMEYSTLLYSILKISSDFLLLNFFVNYTYSSLIENINKPLICNKIYFYSQILGVKHIINSAAVKFCI